MGGALLLAGRSSLRTSSRDYLTDSSAQFLVAGDEQETASRVEQVLRKYGLKRVARKPHGKGGMLQVFTGIRKALPRASFARVKMLGKPMLNGTPVCSDEDAAWGLEDCESPRTSGDWEGAALMTGREEAHVIQAALRDLRLSVSIHPPRPP